jgi:hypothetical protein
MTIRNKRRCRLGVLILALIGLQAIPVSAAEPGVQEVFIRVTALEFDECEPVQVRSKIMEVRADKGTIVVAEREIREMDVETGGRRIKTVYLNPEGQPAASDAFRVGQDVLVRGFLHPDGYVAASEVQKIEKLYEKKMVYKPVASQNKASRKGMRQPLPTSAGQ